MKRSIILITIMETLFIIRIIWEMDDLNIITFLHQFFWFYFVALWFAASFLIIGKIPLKKVILAAPGAIIIFMPLLYAHLLDIPLELNYYQIENVRTLLFDLSTLLYFHAYNFPMFWELFTLLFGSFLFVYQMTKEWKRSLATAFIAFYGSFLIAGVSWFSVSKTHDTLFYIPTNISPQLIYTVEFFILSVIIATLIFFVEQKKR